MTQLDVDLSLALKSALLVLVTFLLSLPIGWERQRARRPAGLRTFPIVAIACCMFVLVAQVVFPDSQEAQSRIIAGLMTGMGFIGGGAILKYPEGDSVRGVTTAASLWTMAAIGSAVAFQLFEIAVILSAANLLILRWLAPLFGEEKDRKPVDTS